MDECDFCGYGELNFVEECLPYSVEHFICPVCDSTYAVEYEYEIEYEENVMRM